jgi:hypothetical protein
MKLRRIFFLAYITASMWLPMHLQQECLSQARVTDRQFTNRHEHIMLVDMPTGCLLEPGTFDAGMRIFPEGGVLGRISVGIADRFMLGMSFGGTDVIGYGKVNWNKNPGVHLKYFLLEESINKPAIAIGFDSQGYGPYFETNDWVKDEPRDTLTVNRYTIKSRGLYCVISKGYFFWRRFGVHLGINRSLEVDDGDRDPTVFLGFDLELGEDVALIGEYDFATNDDGEHSMKRTRGYLNAGLRWIFMDRIYVEFDFKQLLDKKDDKKYFGREIKIAYVQPF